MNKKIRLPNDEVLLRVGEEFFKLNKISYLVIDYISETGTIPNNDCYKQLLLENNILFQNIDSEQFKEDYEDLINMIKENKIIEKINKEGYYVSETYD